MGRRPKKPGAVTRLRERAKPSGKTYYYYDAGGKPRKEVPLGSDYGLAIMKYAELERDRNADNLSEKVVTLRYVSTERDIRDGMLHLRQGKTKAKRRIVIEGELAALLDRIKARKAGLKVSPTRLIVSADGLVMSKHMLRDRFDLAREAAGVEKSAFQLRDLRVKAGSDKSESTGDILKVRDQLGHTTVAMTDHYIRNRRGKKVTPTR